MKVVVTGVAGFIGYHVTKKLILSNYKVVGIDNINNYYDIRLKKDIQPLNDKDSLQKLLRLNPVSYLWKEDTPTSLKNGFPF